MPDRMPVQRTRRLPPNVLFVLALVVLSAENGGAQNPTAYDSLFPTPPTKSRAAREAIRPAFVDASTRWAFRALDMVTVNSPIVRLGDVVRPLDPDMSGWQRLSRAPIGLVPLGGQVMTIDRARLSQAILSAEATARTIEWVGAEKIEIRYRPEEEEIRPTRVRQAGALQTGALQTGALQTGAPQTSTMQASVRQTGSVTDRPALGPNRVESTIRSYDDASFPSPDPVLSQRLIYWIELAIGRHYPEVAQWNEIQIEPKQPAIANLQMANGVDHVSFRNADDAIREGKHRISVTGRSKNGPMEAEVEIVLRAHPVAIVPKESFRRGHLLQSHDLTTRPIPEADWNDRFITNAEELIGMEAKTTIRGNVPITRDSVGMPTLIRRSDRVEVRVLGGGISVTTTAKAMEDGSESDLIQVETLEPRKRLMARVAAPGIVEIVTRPPRIQ